MLRGGGLHYRILIFLGGESLTDLFLVFYMILAEFFFEYPELILTILEQELLHITNVFWLSNRLSAGI